MHDWVKINEIFEAAVELPLGERLRYVEEAAGGAEGLVQQVMRLLEESEGAGARIEAIVAGARGVEEEAGGRIGPYRLVRELGRGGMGTVWLAERADGAYEQQVAIKRVKVGLASEELVQRFRHERRILSKLSHPNIARLVDGGTTADGQPYLVMEYVDGPALGRYVEERGCGVREVVRLFRTVCLAVQHAHRMLVVHRDLKPANILVTGEGVVKLLDFGIAKLVESGEEGEATVGWQPFTPAYASPEQKAGQAPTTASDVYSLGKILQQLAPAGERDLAAIAAKASREEAEGRYESVAQMVEDLDRWSAGRPVEARRGNWTYAAGKFLKRHRWSMAAVGVSAAMLVGFSVWTVVQGRRLERERDRAEAVSELMRGLFEAADPERNLGVRVTARDLLDVGAAAARAERREEGAWVLETIGEAYLHLGLYERAVPVLEEAVKRGARARVLGWLEEAETARGRRAEGERWGQRAVEEARRQGGAELAEVLGSRCGALHLATKYAEAAEACRAAVEEGRRVGLGRVEQARLLLQTGTALKDNNDYEGAARMFGAAMERAGGGRGEPVRAQAKAELSSVYFRQGRMKEAEAGYREAVAYKRSLYPDGHLDLARTLNNLANVMATQKRFGAAKEIYAEAHPLYRRYLGAESSELASSLSNLAVVETYEGNLGEAERILKEVLGMHERTIGAGAKPALSSMVKLAAVELEGGKRGAAVSRLEQAIAGLERLKPVPKMDKAYAQTLLAEGLVEGGQAGRGLELVTESGTVLKGVLKPGHWMLTLAGTVRGGALVGLGRREEARAVLAPMVEEHRKAGAKGWRTELLYRYGRKAGVLGAAE